MDAIIQALLILAVPGIPIAGLMCIVFDENTGPTDGNILKELINGCESTLLHLSAGSIVGLPITVSLLIIFHQGK